MNFEQLLKFGVDQGASAIHLQAEASPQLRIGGLIRNVEGPPVKAEELRAFIASIAPKSVADDLDRSLADGSIFSTSIAAGRFRCTTFSQIGGPGLVLRVVPSTIRSVEELNLPRGRPRGRAGEPGPHPDRRPERQREDHDPGRDGRPDQRSLVPEGRDHRGPGRIPARKQEGHDHPDGGRAQRILFRARPRAGAAAGRGRDRRRRPARSRGGADGPGRGRGGPERSWPP